MEFERIVALRLSKEGYGRPDEILGMPADLVLEALEYSGFLGEYQDAMIQLNKEER